MSKRVLKNIFKNGNEYEVGNIKIYVITEDIVSIDQDSTKGKNPYDSEYGYTNITIDESAGIKWKEGAAYIFVTNSHLKAEPEYRNVRIRIGVKGDYIPLMNSGQNILDGGEFFVKERTDIYIFKTVYLPEGGLHMNNDTMYSTMSVAEGEGGVSVNNRVIRADYLKQIIEYHISQNHDSTKADVSDLNKKQDKLVAGTDISIANPIVPDGYTQLTYLGANGQINLGFRTTNNSRIEASWTKNKNAAKFLYQADSGSTLTTNTTAYSTTGNANWRFGNRYASINTSALTDYLTVQDSSGVRVNGTLYAYSTVNTFTSTNYFKVLYTGDADIIRLKYLKHYSSDELTLYIVPAKRNSDGAYGFYDVVGERFFTDDTLTYDVGEEVHPIINFSNESGYALDSEVVHNTGDETIGGAKTFTSGIEVQVNSDAGLNIKSNSAGGYLYVTRGSGNNQVQSEIKSVSSGGAFGTATNHPLMLRTNDTTQVTVGTDGSMVLNTDVASNSDNNQVATTKWTNSKLGDYLAKDNITAFTPSGDYNPATKKYVDDKQSTITVTLTSAGWSSSTQTVTATGVTANNTVFVAPAPSSLSDYVDNGVYCTGQGSNSLTFTCSSTPSSDITVNVAILN